MHNLQLADCDSMPGGSDMMIEVDSDQLLYGDWGLMEAFWTNPLNAYGTTEMLGAAAGGDVDVSRTVYTLGWNVGIPIVGAAMVGGELGSPTMVMGALVGAVGMSFAFGAMSAAYLVYSVKTDPAKEARLQEFYSAAASGGPSTRPFSLTPGFGSMV